MKTCDYCSNCRTYEMTEEDEWDLNFCYDDEHDLSARSIFISEDKQFDIMVVSGAGEPQRLEFRHWNKEAQRWFVYDIKYLKHCINCGREITEYPEFVDEKDKKLQEVMSNIVGLVRGRELIILDKIERFIDNEIEIPNDIGAIKLTQFFEEEIQRIKTGETYINWKQSQIQLAIAELEKVKELLLDEYKKYPIVYDKTNDIVAGALDRDKVNEIIDQQIKELRGE